MNSGMNIRPPDTIILQRKFYVLLAVVGVIAIAGFALTTGNTLLMLGFVALPFLLMLMHRPDVAFVIAFMLDATGLGIPGVSYTTLGLLAKLVIVASVLLAFLMVPSFRRDEKLKESASLKMFAAITLMLMAVRGTGLRFLGSETWGGMSYIVLLTGIAFYFSVQHIHLSNKQIRWLLWGMAVFGLLGALMSRVGWESATESASETIRGRLQWLRPLVLAAFPLVFALRWKVWIKAILWIGLLGLMGLTGFRSMLVGLVIITAGYGFFIARSRFRYIIMMIPLGLALWVLVVAASPSFPIGLQRAVSFVPGATVDEKTMQSATGSIEWRLEIWEYCFSQSKDYLLIGRGSAFDAADTAAGLGIQDVKTYSPWFAFETRSYHSGPLALLIDFGLPGLIAGTWFMVLIFVRFWRSATVLGKNKTLEGRYALYWCVYMLWHIVAFYLVYGSTVNFANRIIGVSIFTVVVCNSLLRNEQDEPSEVTDTEEAPANADGALT